MDQIFNKIKNSIAKGQTENAIDLLAATIRQFYKPYENDIVLISSQYKLYVKKSVRGTSMNNEINRINEGILVLIDEIKSNIDEEVNNTSSLSLVDAYVDEIHAPSKGELLKLEDIELDENNYPNVDFKFQNLSDKKVLIYEFVMNVREIEINNRPDFEFSFDLGAPMNPDRSNNNLYGEKFSSEKLRIFCQNNGWGSLKDCTFNINILKDQNIVNSQSKVFSEMKFDRIQLTEIEVGDIHGDVSVFGSMDLKYLPLRLFDENEEEQKVTRTSIIISWNCTDFNGNRYTGHSEVNYSLHLSGLTILYLKHNQFHYFAIPVMHSQGDSMGTYVAMLNPMDEDTSKKYKISRIIDPFDIERFHIQIGTKNKSFYAVINFDFLLGNGEKVSSEYFRIEVIKPRDEKYLSENFIDGQNRIENGFKFPF